MNALYRIAYGAYRRLAHENLRSRLSPVLFDFALRLNTAKIKGRLARRRSQPGPIVVSGLMSRCSGIGRAGRLTATTIEAAGFPIIRHDAEQALSSLVGETLAFPASEPGGLWIVHLNAPEAEKLLSCYKSEDFTTRRLIGYWAYELQPAPSSWRRVASIFDEIWVPSRFTADAVKAVAPSAKIRIVPHPTPDISDAHPDRPAFDLPEGKVIFLSLFDSLSSITRKNPSAAIDAYVTAFPQPTEDAMLVVKALEADVDSAGYRRVLQKAKRSDIRLITDRYSDSEMLSLIASIDVLISLHRSEGFGLTLLEAMALKRAVIATGWSGNLEFMTPENSVLINHVLVPVDDQSGLYANRGRVWAQPDIADAARSIYLMYQRPASREAIGAQAELDATINAGGAAVEAGIRANRKFLK